MSIRSTSVLTAARTCLAGWCFPLLAGWQACSPTFELMNTDCIILGEIVILGFSVGGMLTLATADKIFNAKVYHAKPEAPQSQCLSAWLFQVVSSEEQRL